MKSRPSGSVTAAIRWTWLLLACQGLFGVAACTGVIGDSGFEPGMGGGPGGVGASGGSGGVTTGDVGRGGTPPPAPASAEDQAPSPALARLSRREVESTLVDMFGIRGLAAMHLPVDKLDPFDTGAADKEPSAVFVEGTESLAYDLAQQIAADAALTTRLSGCTPTAPDDQACLRALITNLGRRLWRRPLDTTTTNVLLTTATQFARESKSFVPAVRFAVAALASSPPFHYRVEIGVADPKQPAVRRLDNFEVASRLSYLVWGSAPDPALLDEAQGPPFTAARLAALASVRVGDPKASEQVAAFHRMWIGYLGLRVPESLVAPMLRETEELVRRVLVTDRRPWSDLFTLGQTLVDPALAKHYGLAAPAGAAPAWVDYTQPERSGVLSHGSFLSLAAREVDDTSPTIRGKFIATRLLCRTVPKPPPEVNADVPPEQKPGTCKAETYAAHRQKSSACYGCHQLMDPVGFGLERFDGLGRYRMVEKHNPACPISGEGELAGVGVFNGMKGLVQRMIDSGELTACGVRQYLQFALGQPGSPRDEALARRLHGTFLASGLDFRRLALALIGDPVFVHRIEM